MALRASIIAAAFAGASAFVAPKSFNGVAKSSTQVTMKVEDMVGVSAPLGFFDPLGYSKGGDAAVAKYREFELKHGRVAMLACLGYIVQEFFHPFGENAASFSSDPLKAASQVSLQAWFQIFAFTAVVEVWGTLIAKEEGYVPGDLLGAASLNDENDEGWKEYQQKELNNGRLAMFGILGMI
ncbi:unnamed protein product, partial [Heterosigma akashiwo]